MAHIPKINFTGSALSTTIQTIINTRDQKNNNVTSGIPTTETLADVYGTGLPSSTMDKCLCTFIASTGSAKF